MKKKLITVWERQNRQKDGSMIWKHNHISDGYNENQIEPKSINDNQKKLWKGAKWRSFKAFLNDGKVETVGKGGKCINS